MIYSINRSEFVAWAQDAVLWDEEKFHAVLCDPPYGIAFMGKEWDDSGGPLAFQAQAKQWGEAMLPLLYPGALVFMFAGTRMWHRLAAGMEDAGFHLWDTLMWIHGQGFPKGQDIHKLGASSEWAGFKTPQLKPAWESILCFRAPSSGLKYAELASKFGSGCLNVDGGRIGLGLGGTRDGEKTKERRYTTNGSTNFAATPGPRGGDAKGRYPANLVLDESSAAMLDEQTGVLTSGSWNGTRNQPKTKNAFGNSQLADEAPTKKSSGGASRFFYCAKAAQKERNNGVDSKNTHPTMKPIELTRWLASLLLPPDSVKPRRLLVPFSGVASEMIGAMHAGWDEVVGIEMDAEYCKIAEARLKHWATETKAL